MNNLYSYFIIIVRAVLLLLTGWAITFFIFWHVRDLTEINQVVLQNREGRFIEQQDGELGKILEDVSSFIEVPISFLYFNIYAKNYREVEVEKDKKIPVLLNIDINGSYTHAIKFGEEQKILYSLRLKKLHSLDFTYSLTSEYPIEPGASTTPVIGSFYSFYIWPTNGSFIFIMFIFGIPLAYAFLAVIHKCWRFILFGKPFTDKNINS